MHRIRRAGCILLLVFTPSVPAESPNTLFHAVLPVRTLPLGPGRLEPRPLDPMVAERLRHLPRPLFLIGSDSLSREWLTRHQPRLQELGAVGLLVAVETQAELETMCAIGQDLIILPVSATTLAETLKLTHYPVLISPEGIEQ